MLTSQKFLLAALMAAAVLHAGAEFNMSQQVDQESACCPGLNVLGQKGCRGHSAPEVGPADRKHRPRLKCTRGMFMLDPTAADEDTFDIGDDGTMYLKDGSQSFDKGRYCIVTKQEWNEENDTAREEPSGQAVQVALVCFPDDQETFLSFTITGILTTISVVFLLLTLIVYIAVPQLRDLQGKCIMCTTICMAWGFFHLALAQLALMKDSGFCIANGFLMYFSMLATFFWMNVVSINVMKSVVFRSAKVSDSKTFLVYNLWGWGMPAILLLATVVAHHTDGPHIKPGFGDVSCWFSDKVATWGYFYGPIAVLLVCNIMLFLVTSQRLWYQTSYQNVTKVRSMKYKFLLYLKLFLVMGISWSFEIMSFVHDTKHVVWLIADTFNCLQGVVFFLVLVAFRRRALRGLAARGLRVPCVKDHSGPDEECDEIVGEEESPAMAPAVP